MGSSTAGEGSNYRRRDAVVELGQRALETDSFDRPLRDAATAVAETQGAEHRYVLERSSADGESVVREAVGRSEAVGRGDVEAESAPDEGPTVSSTLDRAEETDA